MASFAIPTRALSLFLASSLALGVAMTLSHPVRAETAHRQILLVAGEPSHGYGAHEFKAGLELLASDLRNSRLPVKVEVLDGTWPSPAQLAAADALVLFSDGGPSNPLLEHLAEITRQVERGMGLMLMHYAVEVPRGEASDAVTRWIGGYYEDGWSTNPHWTAAGNLDDEHPVARGVRPFELLDEWYFNIRFAGPPPAAILTAVPDAEARAGATAWPRGPHPHIEEAAGQRETLLWAIERDDGGRGVGFTGGHFHWNWANPDYTRLVLNAILWSAGGEVPPGGVPVADRTMDDLLALEPATLTKQLDYWLFFDEDAAREGRQPG